MKRTVLQYLVLTLTATLLMIRSGNATQLSGTYTIDTSLPASGSNFQNLRSAVAFLTGRGNRTDGGVNNTAPFGVSGHVVFNIANGTYTEQIDFGGPVTGASPTSTITFQSANSNPNSVILRYNADSLVRNYVVNLSGTSFINFKHLTLSALSLDYGTVILLSNNVLKNTSFDTIYNCILTSPTISISDPVHTIIVGGNYDYAGTGLGIIKNKFMGGSGGLMLSGVFPFAANLITVDSNIFENPYSYAISSENVCNFSFCNNIVRAGGNVDIYNFYGVYINYADSALKVLANNIILPAVSGAIGMYIGNNNGFSGKNGLIANNMIYVKSNSPNNVSGLKSEFCSNTSFVFNSVYVLSASTTSYAAYFRPTNNVTIKNNIFKLNGGGYSLFMRSSQFSNCNYNILYSNSGKLVQRASPTGIYNTLSAWTLASGKDSNSFAIDPPFINDSNLHVSHGCYRGTPLTFVIGDFDGNLRNVSPSIGADELALFGNDIKIQQIVSPQSPFNTGVQSLKIIVRNIGSNAIGSYNISYKLNGSAPVTLTTGTFLNPCDTETITFPSVSFSSINNLTVYTSQPGGFSDDDRTNDTIRTILYGALNGSYTIGGSSPDFNSFNDAINALKVRKVGGPVVFNIRSGFYIEQIDFGGSIQGTTQINTVTFQAENLNADSVTIMYNAGGITDNFVVSLSGASYIHFKHITLKALSRGFGDVLHLTSSQGIDATYNKVYNCKLISPVVSTDDVNNYLVYANGLSITGFNEFSQNTFIGGSSALYLLGISSSTKTDHMRIDSNVFIDQYYRAIDVRFTDNLKIRNNTIRTHLPVRFWEGIYVENCDSAMEILGNLIVGKVLGGAGLYIYKCKGLGVKSALVANNSISINLHASSIQTFYGIYNQNCSLHEYLNNSVFVSSKNSTGIAAYFGTTGAPGIDVKNNIFSNNSEGVPIYSFNNQVRTDYNFYYTKGTDYFTGNGTGSYNSLAVWTAATGMDSNSFALMPPPYQNDTDLHLVNGCYRGVSLTNVMNDLDGNSRSGMPNIGAYEFQTGINDLALQEIVGPTVPFSGGLQNMDIKIQNVGTSVINTFNISYQIAGGSLTTQSWTGTLNPCSTVVITFSNTPIADALEIKIYSSLPNGLPDYNHLNDTIHHVFRTALNGSYMIANSGPNIDFFSFTEAAEALNTRGVNGPVICEVAAGSVFTEEPILFRAIPGSDTYPIIFRKNGTGANPIVNGVNGVANIDAVITLRTVKNMTFDGIDTRDDPNSIDDNKRMEYGYAILNVYPGLVGSSNNTIKNCHIILNHDNIKTIGIVQHAGGSISAPDAQIGGGQSAIAFSGGNHNNRYENIHVTNSISGIVIQGGRFYPDSNNIITSSGNDTTIIGGDIADDLGNVQTADQRSEASYGIYMLYQKDIEVSNTVIRNMGVKRNIAHGIYLFNTGLGVNLGGSTTGSSGGTATIKNNIVYNINLTDPQVGNANGVSQIHGIRFEASPGTTQANISNNIIHDFATANLATASANILVSGFTHCVDNFIGTPNSADANYFNNTVLIGTGNSSNVSSAVFYKGGSPGITNLRNNAFINTTSAQSSTAMHYALNVIAPFISSNNLLWSSEANGFIGGTSSTLSDWKISSGADANSLSYFPILSASNHLKPDPADTTSWALNGRGIHLDTAIISKDILGNLRPFSPEFGVPDIGAYEFTPTSTPPVCIVIPTQINPFQSTDTLQHFLFGEDTVASIRWLMGSDIPSNTKIRLYTGTRPAGIGPSEKAMYAYAKADIDTAHTLFSYGYNLHYQNAWLGNIASEGNLSMTRQLPFNPWEVDSTYAADTVNNILYSTWGLTNHSFLFTGTDKNAPLPVKLISLKGKASGADAILNWVTASEINSERFEIERSVNGKQFEHITSVKAAGNSSRLKSYVYTDVNPAKGASVIYYRLRMVDRDGKAAYSNTVNIKWDTEKAEIPVTVFPNPFTGETFVNLTLGEATIVNVTVTDLTGRMVSATSVNGHEGENTFRLDGSRFNSGIYFVNISYGGIRTVQKIIKQ